MADLNITHSIVQDSPKVACIALAGEFDLSNSRDADQYVENVLKDDAPEHILLDLSGLAFAGSDFFSSLLFWKETVAKEGGKLALYGMQPQVASTLRLFVLDRVVTVCPDQATALAKVTGA